MDSISGQLKGLAYTCPHCSKTLDGFTSLGHVNPPEPGDLSVCAYCSCALEFVDNGLVPLTTKKFNALPKSERMALLKAGALVQRLRLDRPLSKSD